MNNKDELAKKLKNALKGKVGRENLKQQLSGDENQSSYFRDQAGKIWLEVKGEPGYALILPYNGREDLPCPEEQLPVRDLE